MIQNDYMMVVRCFVVLLLPLCRIQQPPKEDCPAHLQSQIHQYQSTIHHLQSLLLFFAHPQHIQDPKVCVDGFEESPQANYTYIQEQHASGKTLSAQGSLRVSRAL